MKKLSKIKLHEVSVLSENEMKMVLGGSGAVDDCDGTKVTSCEGKEEGERCCFKWNGRKSYGKCRKYAPSYKIHCSDLN